MRLGSDVEEALALDALPELLLPDALHQLRDPVLGVLDDQRFSKLLLLIEADYVGEELLHIEHGLLLICLRHLEQLDVHSQL